MTLNQPTIEAQSVLDDLWNDSLIPFQLTAHKVEYHGKDDCTICFHDSRLYSVDVSWSDSHSFKDAFRHAILARVRRLDGPLEGWTRQRHEPRNLLERSA